MRYKTILLLVLSAWGIMACQNYTDKIAVEIRQPVYPVLTLKEHNPVLCLRLIRNSGVAYRPADRGRYTDMLGDTPTEG